MVLLGATVIPDIVEMTPVVLVVVMAEGEFTGQRRRNMYSRKYRTSCERPRIDREWAKEPLLQQEHPVSLDDVSTTAVTPNRYHSPSVLYCIVLYCIA